MRLSLFSPVLFFSMWLPIAASAQQLDNHWSTQPRQLRYKPDGPDFVIENGTKRFNRALYGTETSFRVEAGDLPEFAMYMQGFGGNIQVGIINGDKSIWLPSAQHVEARYKGAEMVYFIRDSLLGNATLSLTVLALANAEGVVVKVAADKPLPHVSLCWAYGGATGKRFRREGDLNTDPESVFYLTPDNCKGALFHIKQNHFGLQYATGRELAEAELYEIRTNRPESALLTDANGAKRLMAGCFPLHAQLKVADANALQSPLSLLASDGNDTPVLAGRINGITADGHYLLWRVPKSAADMFFVPNAGELAFADAQKARDQLVNRIVIQTPDPYINTLGPTLAAAADGIWESPTYMHGAIGWRMRLNGWRGPYTADPLGWHNRAHEHIAAYTESQITSPLQGPSVPDPKANLARQEEKLGNALFTSGYISRNPNGDIRPHHYDMNLVFIDNMLRHFRWTGDTLFMRQMWPVLVCHLAWEKRNFDADNDGLYDAYCCIWASDALEYGGGGVTHSSAYNYLANRLAAQVAKVLNADPLPYQREADKILEAMQARLWLPRKGWFAEYVDWAGQKRAHEASALWTIYHALDSQVADPFQAWQSSRYVEANLPQLPVKASGLDDGFYVHSTTNWQPYDWSINNVVMAENLHMALAHWQSGRSDVAFQLWKSTLLDAMYLGSSPGNFVQLSPLDAARGEMYRDFADEVGMTARSMVEGLFGMAPNLLGQSLTITPGFPENWDFARLKTPDVDYRFKMNGAVEQYEFATSFPGSVALTLHLRAKADGVAWVKVNGNPASWKISATAVGSPLVEVACGSSTSTVVEIKWQGKPCRQTPDEAAVAVGEQFALDLGKCVVVDLFDPQMVLKDRKIHRHKIDGIACGELGHRTLFAKIKQGQMSWWLPVEINLVRPCQVVANQYQPVDGLVFGVVNNTPAMLNAQIRVNHVDMGQAVEVNGMSQSQPITVRSSALGVGNNLVECVVGGKVVASQNVANWQLALKSSRSSQRSVGLSTLFNGKVTQIFEQEYLSPRWPYPTLQLPKHGVGNWCYNNIHPVIDDSGLRKLAGASNHIELPLGFGFDTPSDSTANNIAFASLYDNYPDSITVPLSGQGRHIYLLMAGSTNPMQSQIANGLLTVTYADGSTEQVELRNPDNWSPIEQDYFHDGFAFNIATPPSPRLHLKTGLLTNRVDFKGYSSINGYSNRVIDGGAANIIHMGIDSRKQLQSLTLTVLSNEVVMGIMAVTVVE